MAAYTTDIESKRWFRVILPTPSVRAELYKAMSAAELEYERRYGRKAETDDAFEVLDGDDQIIIRFEIEEGR